MFGPITIQLPPSVPPQLREIITYFRKQKLDFYLQSLLDPKKTNKLLYINDNIITRKVNLL